MKVSLWGLDKCDYLTKVIILFNYFREVFMVISEALVRAAVEYFLQSCFCLNNSDVPSENCLIFETLRLCVSFWRSILLFNLQYLLC